MNCLGSACSATCFAPFGPHVNGGCNNISLSSDWLLRVAFVITPVLLHYSKKISLLLYYKLQLLILPMCLFDVNNSEGLPVCRPRSPSQRSLLDREACTCSENFVRCCAPLVNDAGEMSQPARSIPHLVALANYRNT
jgi:hypothetical protein